MGCDPLALFNEKDHRDRFYAFPFEDLVDVRRPHAGCVLDRASQLPAKRLAAVALLFLSLTNLVIFLWARKMSIAIDKRRHEKQ